MPSDGIACNVVGAHDQLMHLRVASIFITLIGSSSGALFPVLAKRSPRLHVPKCLFE
jgi:zinc transporter 1/2/3